MFPVKQTVIYTFFAIKAVNPSKTLLFDSVFVMFPVKHTVIYTFFAYNVQSKTLVFAVFSMLWHPKTLQNLAMYNVFFHFWPFFHCRESYQNDPKFHFNTLLRLRHPKILEKCRKHHRILVSVRNRFWPPPPAKADIATAILTNVIEHLVLLFPPNKHAFTAKVGVIF